MTDLRKLIDDLEKLSDSDVEKARDEALNMAKFNCLVAESAVAILAGRGRGMPRLAETLKVVKRVGALQ